MFDPFSAVFFKSQMITLTDDRFLMGCCEAGTFPCITSMLARWAPEGERALMSTMIMAGSQVRPGDTVLYLH